MPFFFPQPSLESKKLWSPALKVDDENGGKAMNPMDSVFDLEKLRAALMLALDYSWLCFSGDFLAKILGLTIWHLLGKMFFPLGLRKFLF